MLNVRSVAVVLVQVAGALLASFAFFAVFGLDTRAILSGNLAAGLFLLAAGMLSVRSGAATFSRRMQRLVPTLALLLVPVAFTGWATDTPWPLEAWPHMRMIVACSLPYGILVALQTSAVVPALAPTASECPPQAGERARAFTYLALGFVALVLLVSLVARAAVASMDESVVAEAGLVVPFLAAAYAFNGIHCALLPTLHLSRRAALLPVLGGGAAMLHVALNLALIPGHGALGAAAATLGTSVALAATTYLLSERVATTPYEHARIAKILAAAAIVFLAALRWPANDSWTWLSAHAATALIGFPVVLALAGFFRNDEREALRQLLTLPHRPAFAMSRARSARRR